MSDKWIPRSVGLLVLLAALPAPVLAEGACTCADICKVKARLEERQRMLDAAQQVADEADNKTFPTESWARKRFIEIAFPDGKYTVYGVQDYGKPPQVTDEQKQKNCDGIWKATQTHEEDHEQFDQTVPNWLYPWVMIFGQEGKFLAHKEANGYAAEVEDLMAELERLKKACPNAPCNEEEQPKLERYAEQEKAARVQQQEQVSNAARRVGEYAGSVQ